MRRPENRQGPRTDFKVTILILRPSREQLCAPGLSLALAPEAQDVNEPQAGRSVEVRGNQAHIIFTVKK
jgi:hypothetical protein